MPGSGTGSRLICQQHFLFNYLYFGIFSRQRTIQRLCKFFFTHTHRETERERGRGRACVRVCWGVLFAYIRLCDARLSTTDNIFLCSFAMYTHVCAYKAQGTATPPHHISHPLANTHTTKHTPTAVPNPLACVLLGMLIKRHEMKIIKNMYKIYMHMYLHKCI